MPIPLAPVTLTAGTAQTVNVGTQGTVGAVVIGNESPYAIMASAGSGGMWVLAQMADRLNCDTTAFNGNITLSASNYLSNSNQAPSYQVYLTVYAPGEAIPGTYPCALSRMFNVGNSLVTNSPANVFEQDLLTPFVYSGYTAAKDGSISNQLDVASGIAFLRQSTDSSLLRTANNASTFLTTTPSTTYFLDLNPDASWSWATTHSGVTNHLTIASVTTDGSGNISAVTDARVTASTLLSAMAGDLAFPNALDIGGASALRLSYNSGIPASVITLPSTGPANAYIFQAWDGAALNNAFAIGANLASPYTYIGPHGQIAQINSQPSVGNFGVPVIVAQTLAQHVTATTAQTVLTFTPSASAALYRVSAHVSMGNNANEILDLHMTYTDGNTGNQGTAYFACVRNGALLTFGSSTFPFGAPYAAMPITVYAKAGAFNFSVFYQDPGGTPGDFVTVIVERMA